MSNVSALIEKYLGEANAQDKAVELRGQTLVYREFKAYSLAKSKKTGEYATEHTVPSDFLKTADMASAAGQQLLRSHGPVQGSGLFLYDYRAGKVAGYLGSVTMKGAGETLLSKAWRYSGRKDSLHGDFAVIAAVVVNGTVDGAQSGDRRVAAALHSDLF